MRNRLLTQTIVHSVLIITLLVPGLAGLAKPSYRVDRLPVKADDNRSVVPKLIFSASPSAKPLNTQEVLPSYIKVYEYWPEGYQYDVDCDNPGDYPEASLPIEEGGEWGGEPVKKFIICSSGGLVYVNIKSDLLAFDAHPTSKVTCLNDYYNCGGFIVEAPREILWECGHPKHVVSHLESNIYLPPGRYMILSDLWPSFWGAGCGRDRSWYRFMDVSIPKPISNAKWALEEPCLSNNSDAFAGHPINTRSGNFTHQEVDFRIPTQGTPLAFERSYNSLDLTVSPFGRGWTHSYNMHLIVDGDRVTIVAPRGSRMHYTDNGDNTFTPDPGVRARLIRNPDNSFTLTRNDHQVYNFDSNGFLTGVVDHNGNALSLSYNGANLTSIASPDGRSLNLTYNSDGLITQIRDPLGRTVSYSYTLDTVDHPLLQVITDTLNNTRTYGYDLDGYLETISDQNGHTVTNQYSVMGSKVITQTNPLGFDTLFAYGDDWTHETDANGNATTYTYDAASDVVTGITDPLFNTTSFAYDTDFNLISVTDPLSRTTSYAWNDCGCNIETITNTLGYVTSMTYDGNNNLTSITDPLDRTTTFGYDAYNNLTSITDPLEGNTTLTYDTYGQMRSSTDANDHTTYYGYDSLGNLSTITDTLSGVTSIGYDLVGRINSYSDANQNTTWFQYDDGDRLISMTNAQDGVTTLSYDWIGNLLSTTDANDHATFFAYDSADRLITVTNALGAETIYTYDPVGNLLAVTDANGHPTHFGYDNINRLETMTDALGNTTSYSYDAVSNLTGIKDPNDHTTIYLFDDLKRLTGVIDPLDHITSYSYDAVGNLLAYTDANDHTTNYQYDDMDRLTLTNGSIEHTWSYSYDAVGNLISSTDANGVPTYYVYDELDRLETIQYPRTMVSYQYDAVGNRLVMTDPNGDTQYDYDDLYRLIRVSDPKERAVQYTYDPVGNLTNLIYPDNRSVSYEYDPVNRLIGGAYFWGNAGEFGYEYDAAGRLVSASYPNGTYTDCEYDNADRLIDILHRRGPEVFSNISYTLDESGNHLTMTDNNGVTAYAYDALDRLVEVDYPNQDGSTYQYDAVGNRLVMTPTAGLPVNYTYDAANRLISVGGQGYTWDDNGNLLNNGRWDFGYDAANRLTSASDGINAVSYTYNGDGLRVGKRENGVATDYVLDVNSSLPSVLVEEQSNNLNHYLYGNGLIAHQRYWHFTRTWHYYHADGLGSTRHLTNQQGNLLSTVSYDVFGALQTIGADPGTTYLFTGEDREAATGLYYLRARYYDPATGRFTQRDPVPGVQAWPDTLNAYPYALNNPANLTDPSGEFVLAPVIVGGTLGGVIGGVGYVVSNPGQPLGDYLKSGEFWRAAGAGAVGGLVSGLMPFGGAGLASAIRYGIAGGMTAGAAEQLTFNLLSPCAVWHENLLQSMLVGGAAGGVFGGVGYGIKKIITAQRLNFLIKQAREQYPRLAFITHDHHPFPKYISRALGIPVRASTVEIDAAYHQLIHNAISKQFPVRDPLAYHKTLDVVEKVLKRIYRRYPLP